LEPHLEKLLRLQEVALAIDKLNRTFLIMRGGALVLYAILALVLIPFLVQWLPELIKAFS